jgi:hypothetical protein
MRKHLAGLLVVAGIGFMVLGFSGGAAADTLTGSVTFSFTLATHQVLTITGATPVTFGTVDPSAAANGSNSITANVKSNRTYNFGYQAGAKFTEVAPGSNEIPISRMSWALSGGGSGAFSGSATTLVTNQDKTTGAGDDYVYTYTLTADWADVPGAYEGSVTYVVSPGT